MAKSRERIPGPSGRQRKAWELEWPEPCHAHLTGWNCPVPCSVGGHWQGSNPLPPPRPSLAQQGQGGLGPAGRTRVPGATLSAQRRGMQTHRLAGGRAGGGLVPIRGYLLVVSGQWGCGLVNRHGHGLPQRSCCLEIALIASNFPCSTQGAQGQPNAGWQPWQRKIGHLS